MYLVDELGKPIVTRTSNPFLTMPSLQGPKGEQVCFLAVVDNGAMINAIDTAAYAHIARRLSPLSPSSQKLRMANGSVVLLTGVWAGNLEWGPLRIQTTFEVFPSGGSWQMLIGKPLLEQVKATHDYSTDTITVPTNTSHCHIHNFIPRHTLPTPSLPTAVPGIPTCTLSPAPSPIHDEHTSVQHVVTDNPQVSPPASRDTMGDVLLPTPPAAHDEIFTRLTEKGPFYPPRVNTILDTVQIGAISPDESIKVCALLCEFADIFALSVKEVKPISTTKYRLNIPDCATFSVKANQRLLNQAQKEFYFPKLIEFENAGVLRPIHVSKVKAVHPTVLAQKAHETVTIALFLFFSFLHRSSADSLVSLRTVPMERPPPKHSFFRVCYAWFLYPVPSCLIRTSFLFMRNFLRSLFTSIAQPSSLYIRLGFCA